MKTLSVVTLVHFATVGRISSFPGTRLQSTVESLSTLAPSPLEENHTDVVLRQKPSSRITSEIVQVSLGSPDKNSGEEKERLIQRRRTTFAVCLAAISGALDVICIQRFGCFAHLMTGNTFKCLTAMTDLRWKEAIFYATTISFYIAGCAGFRLLDIRNNQQKKERSGTNKSTTYALSTVLLPIFAVSDILAKYFRFPALSVPILWAFGFGMVNASAMDAVAVVTNAVTGHWQKLGLAAADRIMLGKQQKGPALTYKVLATMSISICVTSLMSRLLAERSRLVSVLPPVGVLIGLAYFALFRWYGTEPNIPS